MKDAKEFTQAVSDFVNNLCVLSKGEEGDQFIELMGREHRTLQQTFTGLTLKWLKHMASLSDNEIDGRNEYSRQIARKLLSNIEAWEIHTPLI